MLKCKSQGLAFHSTSSAVSFDVSYKPNANNRQRQYIFQSIVPEVDANRVLKQEFPCLAKFY